MDIRHDLLSFLDAAIQVVEGKQVVEQALPEIVKNQPDDSLSDTNALADMQIVAIGKAAESMLQGAFSYLEGITITNPKALLISKTGHISPESYQNPAINCIESAHPVPDETSLVAGQSLITFLQSSEAPCLFLISGGTSSLVEVLNEDWSLQELQEITQWMLANAYSIEQINSVRCRISSIKAGGLWRYLGNRKAICLMISDVPDDDVRVIGSGLLFPEKQRTHSNEIPNSLPEHWKQKLSPSITTKANKDFYWKVIASNTQAKNGAAKLAKQKGYAVQTIQELQQGLAVEVAKHCVQMAKENPNTVMIWGAETTVILPESVGRGGRNQHLALAAAIELQGLDNAFLLSAGTDGTDGVTDDAGAIVDGQSLNRAAVDGYLAKSSLKQADSGYFLCASGDLISTGVTGTNVMDVIIAFVSDKG
ncbi:MAG TPA: DUF4147 domain-containing protein [Thiothrix sp.]|nr:DUF4147 domain-containing protein [Thiothrix sp.]